MASGGGASCRQRQEQAEGKRAEREGRAEWVLQGDSSFGSYKAIQGCTQGAQVMLHYTSWASVCVNQGAAPAAVVAGRIVRRTKAIEKGAPSMCVMGGAPFRLW